MADDPGGRGTLDIRPRAVERLAATAAVRTPGVARSGGAWSRDTPRIEIGAHGDRLRARVEIAVTWGSALAATATAVSDQVADALGRLGGFAVDTVDVHVAAVVPADTGRSR